jgi:hypothetical protein
LIPASFLCGIGAAILIWRGGEKTKRVEEIRQKLRDALAEIPYPTDEILPQPLQIGAVSPRGPSNILSDERLKRAKAVNSSSEKLIQ